MKGKSLSHVQLFVNPWIAAYQAPPSMGFSRQEYWSGVPLPSVFGLLLLLLSRFSHVRLCANQWTAAHQAPPPLGFSRQEHRSGLPFSSPMHESESEVTQSCPTPRDPMDCSPPGSSVHGIFQARVLEWVAIAFSSPYTTLTQTTGPSLEGQKQKARKNSTFFKERI